MSYLLVSPFSEVKSVSGRTGLVEGRAITFGTPDSSRRRDIFEDFTDYDLAGCEFKSRVYYDHGFDETLRKERIGKSEFEVKEDGVWAQTQLDLNSKWRARMEMLIEREALGYSTGNAPHLVERKSNGDGTHTILVWPLGIDLSLTPEPAHHGSIVEVKRIVVPGFDFADESIGDDVELKANTKKTLKIPKTVYYSWADMDAALGNGEEIDNPKCPGDDHILPGNWKDLAYKRGNPRFPAQWTDEDFVKKFKMTRSEYVAYREQRYLLSRCKIGKCLNALQGNSVIKSLAGEDVIELKSAGCVSDGGYVLIDSDDPQFDARSGCLPCREKARERAFGNAVERRLPLEVKNKKHWTQGMKVANIIVFWRFVQRQTGLSDSDLMKVISAVYAQYPELDISFDLKERDREKEPPPNDEKWRRGLEDYGAGGRFRGGYSDSGAHPTGWAPPVLPLFSARERVGEVEVKGKLANVKQIAAVFVLWRFVQRLTGLSDGALMNLIDSVYREFPGLEMSYDAYGHAGSESIIMEFDQTRFRGGDRGYSDSASHGGYYQQPFMKSLHEVKALPITHDVKDYIPCWMMPWDIDEPCNDSLETTEVREFLEWYFAKLGQWLNEQGGNEKSLRLRHRNEVKDLPIYRGEKGAWPCWMMPWEDSGSVPGEDCLDEDVNVPGGGRVLPILRWYFARLGEWLQSTTKSLRGEYKKDVPRVPTVPFEPPCWMVEGLPDSPPCQDETLFGTGELAFRKIPAKERLAAVRAYIDNLGRWLNEHDARKSLRALGSGNSLEVKFDPGVYTFVRSRGQENTIDLRPDLGDRLPQTDRFDARLATFDPANISYSYVDEDNCQETNPYCADDCYGEDALFSALRSVVPPIPIMVKAGAYDDAWYLVNYGRTFWDLALSVFDAWLRARAAFWCPENELAGSMGSGHGSDSGGSGSGYLPSSTFMKSRRERALGTQRITHIRNLAYQRRRMK